VKNKIVTKVFFKDAIQLPGGVFNDLSIQKHKAELAVYPQGVHVAYAGNEALIPYGNIKLILLANEATEEK
jgi:hypothetical protein